MSKPAEVAKDLACNTIDAVDHAAAKAGQVARRVKLSTLGVLAGLATRAASRQSRQRLVAQLTAEAVSKLDQATIIEVEPTPAASPEPDDDLPGRRLEP
jgi:hypothetical protein